MPKHSLLIALATLAAAALFAVTLLVDAPNPGASDPRSAPPEGPPEVAPFFDPDRAADAGDQLASPELFQDVTQGQYRFRDEQRETLLFYDRITPKPHGVLDVEQPIAQVYFAVDQVLEIRADACTFIAPDNQPRGGAFQGHVVVTLFETEDGSPVAFDNPDHIQLRAYLEEATFDLDLGQLESQSPVELTGRQVAFRGRGLSLIYNELRRRIERLEIAEGEMLRFTPRRETSEAAEAEADVTGTGADDGDADAGPALARQSVADVEAGAGAGVEPDASADADADAVAEVDAGADAEPAAAEPFYRARFERDVRVDAEGGAVQLTADALEAVFMLRSGDWDTSAASRGRADELGELAGSPGPTRYATARADSINTVDPTATPAGVVDDAAPSTDALAAPEQLGELDADRSVTVRWRGPMVLEPELEPDPDLTGPDDLLLRLVGRPARLETAEDGRLTADEIEYVTSTGRIRATGTPHAPVHMVSATMGELQAVSVHLNQRDATGTLQGPGWLTNRHPASDATADGASDADPDSATAIDAGADAGAVADADADAATGNPLRVAWHDQLDLRFHRQAEADAEADSRRPGVQLAGLDTAHFHGSVQVTHPAFDLDAGQLALHMYPPGGERQAIERIEASEGTHLRTAALAGADDADAGEQATVEAGTVAVAFELDADGTSRPRRVTARESVVAAHPQWRLAAGAVDVELAEPTPEADAPADADADVDRRADAPTDTHPDADTDAAAGGEGMLAGAANVRQLTAERDVSFTLIEQDTELAGNRMVVNVPADEVELFGDESNPARLVRADATLAGPHITLAQQDRSVHVAGPGWLDANLAPGSTGDGEAQLNVHWQESLTYDDAVGRAHVAGDVHSQSNTATNRTRLTTAALTFHLAAADTASAGESDKAAGTEPATEPASTEATASASASAFASTFERRRITSATAEGDAEFLAESLDPETGERVSRVQLEGPAIHFDGDAEQLTVPGAGRMVLTDTRPVPPDSADASAANPPDEPTPADESAESPPASATANATDNTATDTGTDTDNSNTATAATAAVNFTGRGVTVFFWQRRLTLDAAENAALFEQDVQMLHQPLGDGPHVQLDAQRLLADFVETGGLTNWTEGDRADVQLNLVRADGNIRILHGDRTIRTDHLQYTADDQVVRLWAGQDNYVEVSTADQPSSLTAESLWWDLARDRFEVRRPGPTIVPLPRSSE